MSLINFRDRTMLSPIRSHFGRVSELPATPEFPEGLGFRCRCVDVGYNSLGAQDSQTRAADSRCLVIQRI